jgi:hypothetical protein
MNDKTCCCGGGFVMQIETGRISKCVDGFSSLNLNWQIISMICLKMILRSAFLQKLPKLIFMWEVIRWENRTRAFLKFRMVAIINVRIALSVRRGISK